MLHGIHIYTYTYVYILIVYIYTCVYIYVVYIYMYSRYMSIRFSVYMYTYMCIYISGVAMISRLLKTIGLFCKRALSKRLYSAKETSNLKEPTNRSQPIVAIYRVDTGRYMVFLPPRQRDVYFSKKKRKSQLETLNEK